MDSLPGLKYNLLQSELYHPPEGLERPDPSLSRLPIRVIQFGTGAFLRGFVDYFIHLANRRGLFDGRVIVVGSTGSGRSTAINLQDGLYTLNVQGILEGKPVNTLELVTSISCALSAVDQWHEILSYASSKDLEYAISNTTEIGLHLDPDDCLDQEPPISFPAKLTAFLFHRAQSFSYNPDRGLVILPCELVTDNGNLLRKLVLELAERWELNEAFKNWIINHNVFCNSLVDRIVPGRPEPEVHTALQQHLGYTDDMLTVAEVYRLWAIEGDEDIARKIRFVGADAGIVVTPDITPYRELKVRILNGAHTIMVSLALLCNNQTVREAMLDPLLGPFIRGVIKHDIVPALNLDQGLVEEFAVAVCDRFENPYIRHELKSITLQTTMKMGVRIIPSIMDFFARFGIIPQSLTFGFAAFLLFRRGDHKRPSLEDNHASCLKEIWQDVDVSDFSSVRVIVQAICSKAALWGAPLDSVPGFVEEVTRNLVLMSMEGVPVALARHLEQITD